MAKRYIAELPAGEHIEAQVFLIASKDLRTTNNGALYIHAVLADRTGQIPARMWQASEVLFNALPEGGFAELKGRTESYKGNMQFIIDAIRPIDAAKVDMRDFVPATARDIDAMWARTVEIVRSIRNEHVRALVDEFINDKDFATRYQRAPAAATMHHAYLGGLCEHTLNLLEMALLIVPRYPELSMDLILAGLFLHDVGKTIELNCDTSFTYSDEGQLLGHINMAVTWIEQRCLNVAEKMGGPFPERIKWSLQHIVLAHHGQYDFGSPKIPATPEAVFIHHLDNLDAKVNTYLSLIYADRDPKSLWTNYHNLIGTKVFKEDVLGVRPKRER